MRAAEAPADLGTRPVGRLLWNACTQTTMSVGTYGVYALTNAWFVSRGVGSDAFAAVNLMAPILLIMGAVAEPPVPGHARRPAAARADPAADGVGRRPVVPQRPGHHRARGAGQQPADRDRRPGGAERLRPLPAARSLRHDAATGYRAGRGADRRLQRRPGPAGTVPARDGPEPRATVLYGATAALLLAVAAEPLIAAFTDEHSVRTAARQALLILAFVYVLSGVAPLISAYFQALGRPRPSYLISIGTLVVIRLPLLIGLSHFGTLGLLISFPAAEALTAGAALLLLRRRNARSLTSSFE